MTKKRKRTKSYKFSFNRPEKNVFNLRKNVRKDISITLQQIRGTPMNIERLNLFKLFFLIIFL